MVAVPGRLRRGLTVLALLLACTAAAASKEYEVKAAFLFNFASFANWPEGAFDSASAPFKVCIIGPDPFGAVLDDTLRGENVGTHPLIAVRGPALGEVAECHILFVPRHTPDPAPFLQAAANGAVLTVGEEAGFLRSGGVLQFVIDEGRVRFDINTAPARKAGVSLTSRLLQVARVVQ
jgi:hypothetical protein